MQPTDEVPVNLVVENTPVVPVICETIGVVVPPDSLPSSPSQLSPLRVEADASARGPSEGPYNHMVFCGLEGKVLAFDVRNRQALQGPSHEALVWKTSLTKGVFAGKTRVNFLFVPHEQSLYVSHNKKIFSIDPTNGHVNWKLSVRDESSYFLSMPEGLYCFGIANLYVVDKADGQVQYHYAELRLGSAIGVADHSQIYLDPLDDNIILVCNCYGFARFGRQERRILTRFRERSSIGAPSILPFDHESLLCCWDGFLAVLRRENLTEDGGVGTYARKTPIPGRSKHPIAMMLHPTVTLPDEEVPLLVVAAGRHLYGYHPLTHVQLWEMETFECRYPFTMAGSTPVPLSRPQHTLSFSRKTGYLYVAGGARVRAVKITSTPQESGAETVWETRLERSELMYVSTIVDDEKGALFCGCFGFLYGLDLETGEIVFENHLKAMGRGHVSVGVLDVLHGIHQPDVVAQPFLSANW